MKDNVIEISQDIDVDKALRSIEEATMYAANAAKTCLENAGLEEYKNFLDTMYHYTRNTGAKARQASEVVDNEELKDFFLHFEEEEDWHYKLARDDLKAFGMSVSEEQPNVVSDFDMFWNSLKDRHHNAYLGAIYVFENIVKYVADDVKSFVKRLDLEKSTSRWLREHNEADLEHGEEVAETLRKYIHENPYAAATGAREASQVWANIIFHAFKVKRAA